MSDHVKTGMSKTTGAKFAKYKMTGMLGDCLFQKLPNSQTYVLNLHDYGQTVVFGYEARSHFSLFNNFTPIVIQNCSICPQIACLGSHSFAVCLCVKSSKIDQNTMKQYYQINIVTSVRKM